MAIVNKLYDTYDEARAALGRLNAAGIPSSDISIIVNDAERKLANQTHDRDQNGVDDRAEGAATGAGVGSALGGAAGLLAGLGLIAIPGIGPVVAAGWLAATGLGAVAGAAAGGIVGALTQTGVSEEDAHFYAEGVRRGGTLLTVRVADADEDRVAAMLDESAVDPARRADAYRSSGWQRFDAAGTGLSAEEIRRQRENYRR